MTAWSLTCNFRLDGPRGFGSQSVQPRRTSVLTFILIPLRIISHGLWELFWIKSEKLCDVIKVLPKGWLWLKGYEACHLAMLGWYLCRGLAQQDATLLNLEQVPHSRPEKNLCLASIQLAGLLKRDHVLGVSILDRQPALVLFLNGKDGRAAVLYFWDCFPNRVRYWFKLSHPWSGTSQQSTYLTPRFWHPLVRFRCCDILVFMEVFLDTQKVPISEWINHVKVTISRVRLTHQHVNVIVPSTIGIDPTNNHPHKRTVVHILTTSNWQMD